MSNLSYESGGNWSIDDDDEWVNDESIISNSGDTRNDQINIELNYSLISYDSLIDDSDDESTCKMVYINNYMMFDNCVMICPRSYKQTVSKT